MAVKETTKTPTSGAADEIAPFGLVETSPGHHSLLLTTFDEAAPAFEAAGHDGGGYAWAAVAAVIIGQQPALECCHLDPEASMFCAYGEDRAALATLGRHLAAAWRDRDALARLVGEADWDEWD